MPQFLVRDANGERTVELQDPVVTVGRASENKISIAEKESSRRHCQIEKTDLGFKLVDLESRNGTRVNGRFVNQHLLQPGDRVEIGKSVLEFVDPEHAGPLPSRPAPSTVDGTSLAALHAEVRSESAAGDSADATRSASSPRVRRGSTTSIGRIRPGGPLHLERAREKALLVRVGVAAGVFMFLLVALILYSSLNSAPAGYLEHERQLVKAEKEWPSNPRAWRQKLATIPAEHRNLHERAQALIRQIDDTLAVSDGAAKSEEEKSFGLLYDFAAKYPGKYEEVVSRCEEFQRRYPSSARLPSVANILEEARRAKSQARHSAVFELQRTVAYEIKRGNFSEAMSEVLRILERYRHDVDVNAQIMKEHSTVMEAARAHCGSKLEEVDDLVKQNRREEGRTICRELVEAFGAGRIEDLRTLSNRAHAKLQTLGE